MARKLFPLQACRDVPPGPRQIPWSVAEQAYGAYTARYGSDQSLEKLADRGGFGWNEMDMLHPAWRTEVSELAQLHALHERCLDLLDGIAYGIRDKFGMFQELDWDETYHVETTITVKDCRELFALLEDRQTRRKADKGA